MHFNIVILIYKDHHKLIDNQTFSFTIHYQILNKNVFLSINVNNKHLITYLLKYDIDLFFKFNYHPNLYIITILMNVQINLTMTYIVHLQLNNQVLKHPIK